MKAAASSSSFSSVGTQKQNFQPQDFEFGNNPLDPILNKLPWNARRHQERTARRMRREVAQLHRDLGIPEDAPYEQVVSAADRSKLSTRDPKKKLDIERAKDKILQLRLNERLAGLTSVNMEARSQSTHEKDGYVYCGLVFCQTSHISQLTHRLFHSFSSTL